MATHQLPSELAYQTESTFGSDPGSWAASGQPLYHLPDALDITAIQREMVEDGRNVDMITGLYDKLHGLYQCQVPFSIGAYGTGVTTSATNQVTQTELGKLLEHCLGGDSRTYSTVVAAGSFSTTTFDPTLTTGIDEGVYFLVEDADDANRGCVVKVESWDGTTVTTDRAMPFTPVEGDVIHGCEVNYVDESVLVDSTGGSYTRAWRVQKGLASSKECWTLLGTKCELGEIAIPRGDKITLAFTINAAKFLLPDDASEATLATAAAGYAPLVGGLDSDCWLEDNGTTTNTTVGVNEVTVTPGVPVLPQEGVTPANSNTPGLLGWTMGPSDTLCTMNLIPHATGFIDEWQADTHKVIRYQTIGAASKVFAVELPNAQIVETPTRGVAGEVSSTQLSLRGHPNSANAAAGDAQLWRSKFKIIRA